MKRKSTEEQIKVMQALIDGSPVSQKIDNLWLPLPINYNSWDWIDTDYRIDFVPKKLFINEYEDSVYGMPFSTLSKALKERTWCFNKYITTHTFIQANSDE